MTKSEWLKILEKNKLTHLSMEDHIADYIQELKFYLDKQNRKTLHPSHINPEATQEMAKQLDLTIPESLFTTWKEEIKELEAILMNDEKPSTTAYALMHVYLGKPITRTNKTKLGKEYGWSGDKLYNKYIEWNEPTKRTGNSESTTSNKARIRNFQMAIKLLKSRDQGAAQSAMKDLDKIS